MNHDDEPNTQCDRPCALSPGVALPSDREGPAHTRVARCGTDAPRAAGHSEVIDDIDLPTDEELMAAHRRRGDPQALNEIVRRRRLSLWVVALSVLGDRDAAEDAVQIALLRVFRSVDTYEGPEVLLSLIHI